VGAWRIARLAQQAESLAGLPDRSACLNLIAGMEEAAAEIEAYVAKTWHAPPCSAGIT
jgi:hypothetical protein